MICHVLHSFLLTRVYLTYYDIQAHDEYTETRVCAFACDLTGDGLDKHISPSSVDIVTMVFS